MSVTKNLLELKQRIKQQERFYHRASNSVQVIAVSKNQPCEKILEAYEAGQKDFAENYIEEALEKIVALKNYNIAWHFIGRIQTNKTKMISEHFSFVHSVTRFKEAKRLNDHRPQGLPPLEICLQVNISEDLNKQGLEPQAVLDLARAISILPRLRLRGLMTILKDEQNYQKQYQWFKSLKELLSYLNQQGLILNTLSMGMSQDMQAAIAAGSTMLRLGHAIFGGSDNP